MEGEQEPGHDQLREALRSRKPRFFRAGRGAARGKTGPQDTARFADNLMILQECAILLGEKLDMSAVSGAVCYEGDETFGFSFDPNSSPHNPEVAGAIVNKRIPMTEFVTAVREYIDQ